MTKHPQLFSMTKHPHGDIVLKLLQFICDWKKVFQPPCEDIVFVCPQLECTSWRTTCVHASHSCHTHSPIFLPSHLPLLSTRARNVSPRFSCSEIAYSDSSLNHCPWVTLLLKRPTTLGDYVYFVFFLGETLRAIIEGLNSLHPRAILLHPLMILLLNLVSC